MKFLFDLGGVFFDWNPRYFFKHVFKSKEELNFFLKNVCNNEWNIKQDCGRPIADAIDELIFKFPKYNKQIKLYYSNHRKMIRQVFQESVDTLLTLKQKKIPCYVLSNWSAETFVGMVEEYPFLNNFDDIMISGEEKLIKPNKKIFQRAIDKFNLTTSETIFIDDNLDNINTSIKLGFKAIHLVNSFQIRKEVNKYLY